VTPLPGLRERILASAVRLFAEQGFDATSVQQIVEDAAVTKGALYHYFDSKNELLFEIYHSLIGVQNADIDRIRAGERPSAETVREILVSVVTSTIARLDEVLVFSREAGKLDPDRRAAYRADRRHYHESFRAVIETGQASGEFSGRTPPETVVHVAMGVVNQLPVWYQPGGEKTPGRLGGEIAEFVLAALRP
jgi:AcrR family transcriptional regulator